LSLKIFFAVVFF